MKAIPRHAFTLKWSNHVLNLEKRTLIMGILNVTPDSFADGGRYFQRDKAVGHAVHFELSIPGLIEDGGFEIERLFWLAR